MKGKLTFCLNDQVLRYELAKDGDVLGANTGCQLQISGANIEPQHCEFAWESRSATWTIRAASPRAEKSIRVNGSRISSVCYLQDGDIIEIPDVVLRFERMPDQPVFQGQPVTEVALKGLKTLVFGRAAGDQDGMEKVGLDPDDASISRRHVVVENRGGEYFLTDESQVGAFLNGQRFTTRKVIIGDRFRIGGYNFEFTGRSIKGVANMVGGKIEGRHLTLEFKSGKRILNDVSIEVDRCSFVGILGGSGQGKTTLMNALCGINPATSGEVWINGIKLASTDDMRRVGIGYVPQDDIVHRELTVEQAVTYSARLRLDSSTPAAAISDLVDETIERLGLSPHRKKGITQLSGGQRKRVSIATELLAKPAVLLLDEPSSGLDPATEFALMTLLRRLAATDCTVLCTTHVLGRAYLFDEVTFIQEGRVIFQGRDEEARKFFDVESLDEIYLKLDNPNKTGEKWRQEFEAEFADKAEVADVPYNEPVGVKKATRGAGGLSSMRILLQRQWTILLADRLNLLFLLAQALLIGGLVGWVSGNVVFQMFLAAIATLWFGCSNGAQQIVAELAIFRRERLAGLGINAYMLSKFVFLTAITTVQAVLIFVTITAVSYVIHPEKLPTEPATWRGNPELRSKVFRESFFMGQNDLLYRDGKRASSEGDEAPAADAPALVDNPGSMFEDDFFVTADKDDAYFKATADISPTIHYRNPTGLRGDDSQFQMLELMAGIFRIRANFLDQLGVEKVEVAPGDTFEEQPEKSWLGFLSLLLGLRAAALLAAALVGVSMGLVVSALVRTPTQAVMWVPLILIPQILFGSFVVTVPEMKTPVYVFSNTLPSYNVQRLMDVANIYGLRMPRVTNKTKIPAFFASPPFDEETVWFEAKGAQHEEKYDKISDVNKSWQNLLVNRLGVGKRFKKLEGESVDHRSDVLFNEGTRYIFLGGARYSLMILGAWVGLSYLLIFVTLVRKQVGN